MRDEHAKEILGRFDRRIKDGTRHCVGVGVTKRDNQWIYQVYVSKKISAHDHLRRTRFGLAARIAKHDTDFKNGEIATEVVVRNFKAVDVYDQRYRPAFGGESIGHTEITAGTIGVIVYKGATKFILSNNHVLANCNDASIGDAIIQPGPYDGGVDPDDRIATLEDFVPLDFDWSNAINYVDCAIARLLTGIPWINGHTYVENDRALGSEEYGIVYRCKVNHTATADNRPSSGLAWPTYWESIAVGDAVMNLGLTGTSRNPVVGETVVKVGRTSGRTEGQVEAYGNLITVSYPGGNFATFNDLILLSVPTYPGDSGSLLVTKCGKKAVGLIFAGDENNLGVACMATRVEDELDITFAPETRLAQASGSFITRITDGIKKFCKSCCCHIVPPMTGYCSECGEGGTWYPDIYYVEGSRVIGSDGVTTYECKVVHYAAISNRPTTGVDWMTVWREVNLLGAPALLQVTLSTPFTCGCLGMMGPVGEDASTMIWGEAGGTFILEQTGNCCWGIVVPDASTATVQAWMSPNCEGQAWWGPVSYPNLEICVCRIADGTECYIAVEVKAWTEGYWNWMPLFYGETKDYLNCMDASVPPSRSNCDDLAYYKDICIGDTESQWMETFFGGLVTLQPYVPGGGTWDGVGVKNKTTDVKPAAKTGCCGDKIKSIVAGYSRMAIDTAAKQITGKPVSSPETISVIEQRKITCSACAKQTWFSWAEYRDWVWQNALVIKTNFKDLTKLPELPIQSKTEARSAPFCAVCKCFIPAKINSITEKCPLNKW